MHGIHCIGVCHTSLPDYLEPRNKYLNNLYQP